MKGKPFKSMQKIFQIDSRFSHVTDVAIAARRLLKDHFVCDGDAAAIELALVEAVNNAIEHAYQGEPGHEVVVELFFTESAVHVAILENGIAMSTLPSGDLPSPNQTSGRGWFLIRNCMDEAGYRSSQGQNMVYMCRYLRSPTISH